MSLWVPEYVIQRVGQRKWHVGSSLESSINEKELIEPDTN